MGRWGGRDSDKSGSRDLSEDDEIAMDPLTAKGEEIQSNMKKEYGPKKGEQVFYASKNAGKIKGVDRNR